MICSYTAIWKLNLAAATAHKVAIKRVRTLQQRCDQSIVGPSSDVSGVFAQSVLVQGNCLVSTQRPELGVVVFNPSGDAANFKGGDVHHCQKTPIPGQTGSRWVGPRRGKISVACDQADSGRKGLVSRDCSAKAPPHRQCCRLVRITYQMA